MKWCTQFFVAGVLMVSLPAFGQTQTELNIESAKAFDKADALLNDTYKNLIKKLDEDGQKRLREAERAWVKFRDAECESEADQYRGGSIMPLIYNTCAKLLTEQRTAQLKERIEELDPR